MPTKAEQHGCSLKQDQRGAEGDRGEDQDTKRVERHLARFTGNFEERR